MQGIIVTKLPDPNWGFPVIARVTPQGGNPWGCLAWAVGTPWESLFPWVDEHTLDQALRGYSTPLMRILGRPPSALVKRLPLVNSLCSLRHSCLNASEHCVPGPKVPDCWEAPGLEPGDIASANYVVQLWRDGITVILQTPKGNTLT